MGLFFRSTSYPPTFVCSLAGQGIPPGRADQRRRKRRGGKEEEGRGRKRTGNAQKSKGKWLGKNSPS